MDTRFTGVIPPVITPFTASGDVDYEDLDKIIDHLIDGGMHGLFVLGSSGEVAYLTDAERDEIVKRTVARAAGRVPVLAGAIDTTAKRVIEHAKRAEALGADGIVATCPFYAINDEEEFAAHFRAIAAAVSIPVFAYDVPVRLGGKKLSRDLLVRLGTEDVIAGVKDSSGDDVGFRRLVAANEKAGHPLALLSGHELMVDGMLLLGADGFVPGYGNVEPRPYREMWDASREGDWTRVRDIQDRIAAHFETVFAVKGRSGDATGIGAFKTAMVELGIIKANHMAFPIKPLEGANKDAVVAIMKEEGLI
ncbi:dihydrodipicolinate synthase family protein [Actinomyces gaoshouyii]|uniref:Dihydrodipicolinate synthase family protein n=1 Tax=Actinomyces gaoshouyii TaxID=1960083 RepID=A0A8H9H9S7_9ACTO|nr:dihydrodipicolinate synthase family protein [Actinomyces gaoshouyii]GGO99367.1 dihydrodipicolinate synthase family protein [Actinomyces gaoshouyii]